MKDIFLFILVLLGFLWSNSLMISAGLLIGAKEKLMESSILLLFGFLLNICLVCLIYWREK